MAFSGGNESNSAVAPYPRFAVALHWAIALLLFAELGLGWWMPGIAKSPPGLRAAWFNVHKSIGIVLLFAALLRMTWRASHPQEELHEMPAWQRTIAQVTHGLLYACMLLMPGTGLAGSMFTNYPILFFGARLPVWQRDWPAAKALMADVHNALAWVFAALIAVHVAAALWHWWRRDPVAARMRLPPLPS